jgi:hypothetical protein
VKVSERCERAASASLADEDWERFSADASNSVRRIIAARFDAPTWVLERLASDPDRHTRQAVVDNHACTADILRTRLGDPEWRVRWSAVQHPNADREVREAASRSQDQQVRWALAQTCNLEPEFVRALQADQAWQIREQVAACHASTEVLEALLTDPDARVRGAVAAHNPNATEQQLRRLAEDRSAVTRRAVAGRRVLPEDVLFRLATDRSADVRWWLCVVHCRNKRLMRVLSDDADEMVAHQARTALTLRRRWDDLVSDKIEDRQVRTLLQKPDDDSP